MKNLNFIRKAGLFLLIGLLAFATGYNAFEQSENHEAVSHVQNHVQTASVDVTAIAASLSLYMRKYSTDIWTAIMKGVDFEMYMDKVPDITNEYISSNSSRTEYLQPWQKGTQWKGGVTLTPYINKVRRIKMDYLEQNMDALYPLYLTYLVDEKKKPIDYPFVKWLVDYHIIPGITEEFRTLSVRGVYAAPTVGTAGNSIASTDGIFTKITQEIAASNLTPIVTGAITPTNVVDLVEDFVRQLPHEYRSLEMPVFCSDVNLENYKYQYRDQFGTNQDYTGPTMKIWGTNKTLVGLPQLNASDRLLTTPKGNMLCMYDKILIDAPRAQEFDRDVKLLWDGHRGYGFRTLNSVFVNDQA